MSARPNQPATPALIDYVHVRMTKWKKPRDWALNATPQGYVVTIRAGLYKPGNRRLASAFQEPAEVRNIAGGDKKLQGLHAEFQGMISKVNSLLQPKDPNGPFYKALGLDAAMEGVLALQANVFGVTANQIQDAIVEAVNKHSDSRLTKVSFNAWSGKGPDVVAFYIEQGPYWNPVPPPSEDRPWWAVFF